LVLDHLLTTALVRPGNPGGVISVENALVLLFSALFVVYVNRSKRIALRFRA
jgi:hypothetical protein